MKRYIGKYLILLGGLLALSPLSGCKLDDPVIPTEELYLRNFIKQYGLIDPTQDFSSAVQSEVTLSVPSRASVVNVYAKTGEDYYRVGCFADLEGEVRLPVDISEATELLMLDVDGVRYYTEPGGTVKVRSGMSQAKSRAMTDDFDVKSLWIEPSKWATVTQKNGETGVYYDDAHHSRKMIFINSDGEISSEEKAVDKDNSNNDLYDKADKDSGPSVTADGCFDVTKTAHIGENLQGDKSHLTTLGDNKSANNPGEVGHTFDGSNVRFLIKNNDDALAAYRFVFRTAAKNNAKLRAVILGQQQNGNNDDGVYVFMDSGVLEIEGNENGTTNTAEKDKYTEWEIRTDLMPRGYYELIIMGVESKANFDGEQTCGNWGFMKMSRIKTAKDMRWILACEDLGTTDDFDFNDVVFSIETVNTNTAAMKLGLVQWQVVENIPGTNNGTVLHPYKENNVNKAPSRAEGDASEFKTQVRVEALAAGGTLPIWLHFREEETNGTGTDYIVSPGYDDGDRGCLRKAADVADSEVSLEKSSSDKCAEWHRWFGEMSSKNMLNTGVSSHRAGKTVTFYTKNVFSLQNFSYLKFKSGSYEGELPYYFDDDIDLDPWAQKVLKWKWQQEHSQEVTFGFFLTVYHPLIGESSKIVGKDDTSGYLISKSLDGLPPQMFLIPDCNPLKDSGYVEEDNGWMWPCERVDITDVYPNFKAWVEDSYSYSGINWFMLPAPGIVSVDAMLYPRDEAGQKAQPTKPTETSTGN